MSKLYITNIQIVYEELLVYTEYTRLLISLLDLGENERKAELAKLHKEFKLYLPDWFRSVNIKHDMLIKLSSNNNPGATIINTSNFVRGTIFGTYRPNKVEVLWTSKNLDLKQEHIKYWIHNKLKPALDKDYNVDLEDLIKRSIFVRSMKG